MKSYCTWGYRALSKYTSIEGGGAYHFKHIWGGGLIETGGLYNLAKKAVSVLHKQLEYKVGKFKYKKLKVMQPRIKNKFDLPVGE